MIEPFVGLPLAALSDSRTLFEAGLILVLAAAAPLIAQVLRLPSILMLLALGFGAGAIGALDPNELLGENLISTVVSIAVGIILFEAGLGLNFGKLRQRRSRLPPAGQPRDPRLLGGRDGCRLSALRSLLRGRARARGRARRLRPDGGRPLLSFTALEDGQLGPEVGGHIRRPIGATLGVVVFNAVIAGHAKAGEEIAEFLLAVGIGAGFGILGGVLVLAWARWFRPSQSQAVTGTLMFVVAMVVCRPAPG